MHYTWTAPSGPALAMRSLRVLRPSLFAVIDFYRSCYVVPGCGPADTINADPPLRERPAKPEPAGTRTRGMHAQQMAMAVYPTPGRSGKTSARARKYLLVRTEMTV